MKLDGDTVGDAMADESAGAVATLCDAVGTWPSGLWDGGCRIGNMVDAGVRRMIVRMQRGGGIDSDRVQDHQGGKE